MAANLAEVLANVRGVLQTNLASVTKDGVRLDIAAANQARLWAEKSESWRLAEHTVRVYVDPCCGGDLCQASVWDQCWPKQPLEREFGTAVATIVVAGGGTTATVMGDWGGVRMRDYSRLFVADCPTEAKWLGTHTIDVDADDTTVTVLSAVPAGIADGSYPAKVEFRFVRKEPKLVQGVWLFPEDNVYVPANAVARNTRLQNNFTANTKAGRLITFTSPRRDCWESPNMVEIFGQTARLPALDPTEDEGEDIVLDAECWLESYTAANESTVTDFFIEHGEDWLMWATVVRLNYVTQTFVHRQEGIMAPPDRERDKAWESLRNWNNTMYDADQRMTF